MHASGKPAEWAGGRVQRRSARARFRAPPATHAAALSHGTARAAQAPLTAQSTVTHAEPQVPEAPSSSMPKPSTSKPVLGIGEVTGRDTCAPLAGERQAKHTLCSGM